MQSLGLLRGRHHLCDGDRVYSCRSGMYRGFLRVLRRSLSVTPSFSLLAPKIINESRHSFFSPKRTYPTCIVYQRVCHMISLSIFLMMIRIELSEQRRLKLCCIYYANWAKFASMHVSCAIPSTQPIELG